MILIFGGAYQGKLEYTLDRFNLTDTDVYRCCEDDAAVPAGKMIIYEIDKWILAIVKSEINIEPAVQKFIETNKDTIVICNDISSGIVPVDMTQRKWREETGRAMAKLSKVSVEVVRLFCGIPSRLK